MSSEIIGNLKFPIVANSFQLKMKMNKSIVVNILLNSNRNFIILI